MLSTHDRNRLEQAVMLLESPGFTAAVSHYIGVPIEYVIKKLPAKANKIIAKATTKAMNVALKSAIYSMKVDRCKAPSNWFHKGTVAASGAIGGFFGLAGLTIELPISTTIMLRSIADIARSEGEDLTKIDSHLACIQVLALGGPKSKDDDADTAYYGGRVTYSEGAKEIANVILQNSKEAVKQIQKLVSEESSSAISRFVARIAARFEVILSEKTAAELVPIIGAVGGAAINVLFISHFQSMAHGHFIVRALEHKYGEDEIKKEYHEIAEKFNKCRK